MGILRNLALLAPLGLMACLQAPPRLEARTQGARPMGPCVLAGVDEVFLGISVRSTVEGAPGGAEALKARLGAELKRHLEPGESPRSLRVKVLSVDEELSTTTPPMGPGGIPWIKVTLRFELVEATGELAWAGQVLARAPEGGHRQPGIKEALDLAARGLAELLAGRPLPKG